MTLQGVHMIIWGLGGAGEGVGGGGGFVQAQAGWENVEDGLGKNKLKGVKLASISRCHVPTTGYMQISITMCH